MRICFRAICFDYVDEVATIAAKRYKAFLATFKVYLVAHLVFADLIVLEMHNEVFCGIVFKKRFALRRFDFRVDCLGDDFGGEFRCSGGGDHGLEVVSLRAKSSTGIEPAQAFFCAFLKIYAPWIFTLSGSALNIALTLATSS